MVNPYEQEIVERLNMMKGPDGTLFPKLISSHGLRSFDHVLKLDIVTADFDDMEKFGLLIQAKMKGGVAKYPLLLDKLNAAVDKYPNSIPVIYHKQVIKGEVGQEYALMYVQDFENLICKIKRYENPSRYRFG
jgi:hypothetical protein